MIFLLRSSFIGLAVALLGACVSPSIFPAGDPCATAAMTITDDFSGARRGACTVLSENHVRLEILPEDPPPINDSPWYAFHVTPAQASSAQVTLRYSGGHHRYWPKFSYDKLFWKRFDPQQVTVTDDGLEATLQLSLDERPIYIAAQEILPPAIYASWTARTARQTPATQIHLGRSREGRRIDYLDTGGGSRDVLFIVGRQHPPEVPGTFAFFAYAETVLGPSQLARRFRERFRVIAIPMLNPDGVNAGNWRHNVGGVDLNRDWGPFTQPETQLISALLDALDASGRKIRLFLDFHATRHNVFYTQNHEFPTDPLGFMPAWLYRAAARIENYEFQYDARPVSEQANSKNYMYKRYGIPTATYEVGDDTDRVATQQAAIVFAEEMMTLMLEAMPATPPQ